MINVLFVGLGGFIGAVMRYLLGLIPIKEYTSFPVITLLINIVGAFVIGVIAALCEKNKIASQPLILFLKVGLCGGFTTFSTFSLESFDLFSEGKTIMAAAYIILSVVFCVLAVFGARVLVK